MSEVCLNDLFLQSRLTYENKRLEALRKAEQINKDGYAVGYSRVSTDMQVQDGYSLADQDNCITDYCKSKGLILEKIYTDAGLSGANRNRQQLNNMLDNLVMGMQVVTYSIDRLARDTSHLLEIKDKIHNKGCTLYIIDKKIDTSDKQHDFLITVMAAVADENRKASNSRVSSVMQNMSREGKLRKKPRYGWKVIQGPDGKNILVEDDDEQLVINIIRTIISNDPKITLSAIAKRLTSEGIHIRKCEKIYTTTLKNIINDNHLR